MTLLTAISIFTLLTSPSTVIFQPATNETVLQSHVEWSIAHEGCDAFSGNTPKSPETMRSCFLIKESHNPEAFNLLKSVSVEELSLAIKRALPLAYEHYQIPANFEWVLSHEHQLELFRDLDRSGNYRRIRMTYYRLQEHNPNARYVLSAVSDDQIKSLLSQGRVAVAINTETSYETLKTIESLTSPTVTTVSSATTLASLVIEVYGSANANIAKLVVEKNNELWPGSTPVNLGDLKIPAGTKIILPSLPAIGSIASLPLQPLTGGCQTCVVIDPRIPTFVSLRQHGTPIEPEVFGHVEIPASRLQSVNAPTVADFGWYLAYLGLSSVDSADFKLSSPVPVGVIDSGADTHHADLLSSFWKTPPAVADARWPAGASGYDFIKRKPDPSDENDQSHGTHVSGLVAGEQLSKWRPEFSKLIAHNIKLVELKVVGTTNFLDSATVQNAILAGVGKGVRIFNCSFELVYESEMLKAYLKSSDRTATTLFVVAAGNYGDGPKKGANLDTALLKQDTFKDGVVPLADVIIVAALGKDGKIAPFSNYGPQTVSIAAPGTDISSTIRNSGYGLLSGTSQAAPFVALAAGMLLSELPSMSLPEIHQRIVDTCDWVPDLKAYVRDGCRLNIQKATIINTDLVELKTGVTLKGTVSPAQLSVPGDAGLTHKVERVWFDDSGHMTIVATDGRYPGTASSITISLANPSLCVGKATTGSCVIPASLIRDVVFRASGT
jgi:Subtilase family